jgi:hypothetical protein
MTDRQPLPNEHHFAKYCSAKLLIREPPHSDIVVGVAPQAFRPRQFEDGVIEQELSGNHLEYFGAANTNQNVIALAKHLKEQRLLTIRSSGRFAVGQVGEMKSAAKSQEVEINIVEDPIGDPPADPSHAVITGIPLNALLAQEELAKVVIPYTDRATPT